MEVVGGFSSGWWTETWREEWSRLVDRSKVVVRGVKGIAPHPQSQRQWYMSIVRSNYSSKGQMCLSFCVSNSHTPLLSSFDVFVLFYFLKKNYFFFSKCGQMDNQINSRNSLYQTNLCVPHFFFSVSHTSLSISQSVYPLPWPFPSPPITAFIS